MVRRPSLAPARCGAAVRATVGVARRAFVERDAELVGQARQPREHVAQLVHLLGARTFARGLRQLAQLLREPRNGHGHAARCVAFAVGVGHELLQGRELHGFQSLARSGAVGSVDDVPDLVALALPGGLAFVDALRRVWDRGDAAFVLDLRLPDEWQRRTLAAMAPSTIIGADGNETPLDGGRPVEPGDALVVATSGTTGDPKGVVLTHGAVAASARATSARIGTTAADHWLACLPLAHIGGLAVLTRSLVMDLPVTVHPSFDADAVRDSGANLVSLVTAALARVDPTWFRVIVLGGARPPVDRPPNAVTTYGMTETGSGCVYDGVPLDGAEVRVDDDGMIHLRGPMLLRAYRDGRDPKDSDGWLRTGDLGEWAADGRLVVHGREGDLIVSGGENVWPDVVEAVLVRAAGVADVAVAGVPHAEWGHEVTAFVVPASPADPPTLGQLRDAVKAELPAWCAPRRLELVGALPRTALGKVRRADLVATCEA